MNRKKVLMIGPRGPESNGDMAITIGIVEQLKELIPDVDLVMLSNLPEIARSRFEPYLRSYDVKIERTPWFKPSEHRWLTRVYAAALSLFILGNCLCWRLLKLVKVNLPLKGSLQEYDIHIHCGTDIRTTSIYGTLSVYHTLFALLFSILTKKPYIIYGETMGPFRGILAKLVVKPILDKASLIMVRDILPRITCKLLGCMSKFI